MTSFTRFFGAAAAFAALVFAAAPAHAQQELDQPEETFITIGTGGVTGVYYPAGGAICRLVNKDREETGVRCSVESTGGSLYNVNALRQGDLEFGVVQSDWQYHAYEGSAQFEKQGPFKKLRSVFSLYAEPFTVLARKDAGIASFADLKGKRVNIGNPGSGQRATMDVVMQAYGWTLADFALASELKSAEQAQALCDNKVDAIVFVAGHPSGSIQEATTTCDTVLVNVDGAPVQKLVKENPFYTVDTIPGGLYRGNPDEITTFGVAATLVTTSDVPDNVVYALVKPVFENLDTFRRLHPALERLDAKQMVEDALSAPLHEGAAEYYKEAGILPQ